MCSWTAGRLDVFARGTDSALWHRWWEPGTPTTYVRREAWALESANTFDPITLAYAKAVQVMQARPASDPTSWTYQAAIHGTFAAPPPGARWSECQHRGWFFLPWHRMYLYFFEHRSRGWWPWQRRRLRPKDPPELAAASERPLQLTGRTTSVRMTVPASSRRLAETAGDEGHVLIAVEDIEAERDPGLAYAVYLEAPGDPEGGRHHIGNVSFFGIREMNDPDQPHEGAAGFGHTFDATGAVKALKERGLWDPASVSITFEPIRVLPPPGEELPEEARAQAAAPVPPVRIGRVSLFVA